MRNPLFSGTALVRECPFACTTVAWRSQLRGWCFSFALLYVIRVINTAFIVEAGINRAIVLATAPSMNLLRMLSGSR